MIPGANLLNMAAGVIGQQTVQWRARAGVTTNAPGFKVPAFAAAVNVFGSFQPMSRVLMQQLGLDMSKNYATFYASKSFGPIERDKVGDLLIFAGRTYEIETLTDWHPQDGWQAVVCVEVPAVAP